VSFAYDTQAAVWYDRIRPHIKDEVLAMHFERLMDSMHDANHKCTHRDSNVEGDGVNKDDTVSRDARKLQEYVKSLEENPDA